MRRDRLRYFSFSPAKRFFTFSSALNALMMRSPLMVSSMLLMMVPSWFCCSSDTRLRYLPTRPMIKPATGSKMNTKSVSCQLTKSIIARHTTIMMGFLNIMSSDIITEFSTSVTSPLMRAITSPLRSLEKKPMGSDTILL